MLNLDKVTTGIAAGRITGQSSARDVQHRSQQPPRDTWTASAQAASASASRSEEAARRAEAAAARVEAAAKKTEEAASRIERRTWRHE